MTLVPESLKTLRPVFHHETKRCMCVSVHAGSVTERTQFPLLQVTTANGDVGSIEGSFGKSGKFKVQFPRGVSIPASGSTSIQLTFKKYSFDKDKRHMSQ